MSPPVRLLKTVSPTFENLLSKAWRTLHRIWFMMMIYQQGKKSVRDSELVLLIKQAHLK